MHTNGHGPIFHIDDLTPVTIPTSIFVAGYQADTSNSLEYRSAPGTSPVSRVIHKMMQQPLDTSGLTAHPAGQMASAYTHFTNLDSGDPLYRYTMGMRVQHPQISGEDIGVVEIPPGEYICLMVPGPFHVTIPTAWSWLLDQFADGTIPWKRTFTGDVELYDFGPNANDSLCAIYVAVENA